MFMILLWGWKGGLMAKKEDERVLVMDVSGDWYMIPPGKGHLWREIQLNIDDWEVGYPMWAEGIESPEDIVIQKFRGRERGDF